MKNILKKTVSVFMALILMSAILVSFSGCPYEGRIIGEYNYEGYYSNGNRESFSLTAFKYKEPIKSIATQYYHVTISYLDPYGVAYTADWYEGKEIKGNRNGGKTFNIVVDPLVESDIKNMSKKCITRKISVTIEKGKFFEPGSMVLVDIYSNYMHDFHDYQYLRSVPENRKTPSNQYCDGCGLLKCQNP